MSDTFPPLGAPDAVPAVDGTSPGRFPQPHAGASTSRRMGGWRPVGMGPNSVVAMSGPELVRRSRDLRRNNPHARRAMNLLTTHTVGIGIKPRSLCRNAKVRAALMELWSDWIAVADADQVVDFYGLQALAMNEVVEGGEAFARLRTRFVADGLPVPLQVQLLPTEQVPLSYNMPNGTNTVTQAIERNAIGQRVAYWCYPQHPGDWYGTIRALSLVPAPVDAADMCHLFNVTRIGQMRGLPEVAAAITILRQLGLYLDAELLRKQTAAMVVAFVKRVISGEMSADEIASSWGKVKEELGDLPMASLEPGTVQYLDPGEDVEFNNPADVGGSFIPFVSTNLRSVAGAVGVIYEELSGDWSGTNDRTFRAAMNTFKRAIQMWQFSLMVAQFCQPVWARFVSYAVTSGAIKVPKSVTPRDLAAVEWLPQRHEYINPVQDIQATGLEMGLGLISRSAAVAERGDDVENVDAQIKADRERETELGLAFPGLSKASKTPDMAAVDQQETGVAPTAQE